MNPAREEDEARRYAWQAVQESIPRGRVRIRVLGTCSMPVQGYRANLTRAPFQSSNPNILNLTFQLEVAPAAPSGRNAVAYEETGSRRYKLVSIQPGAIDISVQDEI